MLETFTAVICASLMCFRPLLVKFLPSIFPVTKASGSRSYATPNPNWSVKLASKIRNPNGGVELRSEDEEARTAQRSRAYDNKTWLTESSSAVTDSIEMHEQSPRALGGPHNVDHNNFH